jgi:acyl transferase domain-containing protein/NADPH:quinone reductase-like Zn-dependent oxidoreductase/NADP-dependent 3-hydroxy acid dehydrogenase YdfG
MLTSFLDGTGTAAGDPLEAQAIGDTFGADPGRQLALHVGSVKSNLGHLEGAAGLAGVIKSILSLETGVIFPQHDFQKPNPGIDFARLRINIPTKMTRWPTAGLRRASVNSFGYGGTNAHVVLDDAAHYLQERELDGNHKTLHILGGGSQSANMLDSGIASADGVEFNDKSDYFSTLRPQKQRLFTFSAPEKAAIPRIASDIQRYLLNRVEVSQLHADQCLADLSYTLDTRRSRFQWNVCLQASTANELIDSLNPATLNPTKIVENPEQLWVFTGQGAQWARMGAELFQYPVFAATVALADSCLRSFDAEWSARVELMADAHRSRIDQPVFAQFLCTVVQIGIVELMRGWVGTPAAVVGHSSGEIAAAYAAGALSAEDAFKIAYHRGRLSQQLSTCGGGMLAVGLSREKFAGYLSFIPPGTTAVVACHNSPTSLTISGDRTALEVILEHVQEEGMFARMLKVSNAYHSPHMEAIAEDYLQSLYDIQPRAVANNVKFFSTVTGQLTNGQELGAQYWVRNMTQPVEFVSALEELFNTCQGRVMKHNDIDIKTICEIGPHGALQAPIKQFLEKHSLSNRIPMASALSRGKGADKTILTLMGGLWSTGYTVDLRKINNRDRKEGRGQVLVDLPSYPWNHSVRYWHESYASRKARNPICGKLDYAGLPVVDFNPIEPLFKNDLRTCELPWLVDHQVQNEIVFPAAGMICAAIEAGRHALKSQSQLLGVELREIHIGKALMIPADGTGIQTYLSFKPYKVGIRSGSAAWQKWTFYTMSTQDIPSEHASGLIAPVYRAAYTEVDQGKEAAAAMHSAAQTFTEVSSLCTKSITKKQHYKGMMQIGINYGNKFQCLDNIKVGASVACASVTIPDTKSVMPSGVETSNLIHPAVLDALFQSSFPAAQSGHGTTLSEAMVPTQIDYIYVPVNLPQTPGQSLRSVTKTTKYGLKGVKADIVGEILDKDSRSLQVSGLLITSIGSNGTDNMPCIEENTIASKICSEVVLRPDVKILTEQQAVAMLGKNREDIISIIQDWFDLAGHANPSMKILEIGTAVGFVPIPGLYARGGRDDKPFPFGSYTFADTSAGNFEATDSKSHSWGDRVAFKMLNIETSPEDQGFTPESFDIVAASNISRTTKNIEATLQYCQKLLKPGGDLILNEVIDGPSISKHEWTSKLLRAGLSGVDYALDAVASPDTDFRSVLVSAKPAVSLIPSAAVVILVRPHSEIQRGCARLLVMELGNLGIATEMLPFAEAANHVVDHPVISLCELDSPFLPSLSTENFEIMKTVITKSSRLLWVTGSTASPNPGSRVVSGLLRSARSENEALRLHELHLQSSVSKSEYPQVVKSILRAFRRNFLREVDLGESEMVEIEHVLHVPRCVESVHANRKLMKNRIQPKPILQPLIQEGRPLKLTVGTPGMLDSLCFVDDDDLDVPLPADFVEIQVEASALNFVDVMVAMGKIPDSSIGLDAAGVVRNVGAAVKALNIGDRVAFSQFGCFSNLSRVHESIPQVIPKAMSAEDACTIPTVFLTAYQCLVEVAHLQRGETLLVHAAAGGLGQALVQLAQHVGATVYATVGTLAKKQLLVSLGVDEDHIFSSRDLSFAQGIMRVTEGRGVDVVVNSLTGEALRKTWECVAEFGRFIEVGKVDIYGNTGLEMKPFLQNRMFVGVNLERMLRLSRQRTAALMKKVFALVANGAIKPVNPVTVFDYTDMEVAFRCMQQGRHTGKLVLKMTADSKGPVLPRMSSLVAGTLRADATYVFAGVGGLASLQAIHLAKQGARNLVFLSRSGATRPQVKQTLAELSELGVKADAFACDITDGESLRAVIAVVSETYPPIRGVIQGAMVLGDSLLENMTHEQWLTATRPKIQGTWNLHDSLPKDLDFFVMLASVSGIIGSRGQANYSAANTFLDAFAAYRCSLGLKAQTIDFGPVKGAGIFEEDYADDAANYFSSLKLLQIEASESLSLLDMAIAGSADGEHELPAQLITSAGSGGMEKLNKAQAPNRDFYWLSQSERFNHLRKLDTESLSVNSTAAHTEEEPPMRVLLATATSMLDAVDICTDVLVTKLAKSIMIDAADIDVAKPLHHYGVDSLVAVEVRSWIMREVKSDVSLFEILDDKPISQLAGSLAAKSKFLPRELREDSRCAS